MRFDKGSVGRRRRRRRRHLILPPRRRNIWAKIWKSKRSWPEAQEDKGLSVPRERHVRGHREEHQPRDGEQAASRGQSLVYLRGRRQRGERQAGRGQSRGVPSSGAGEGGRQRSFLPQSCDTESSHFQCWPRRGPGKMWKSSDGERRGQDKLLSSWKPKDSEPQQMQQGPQQGWWCHSLKGGNSKEENVERSGACWIWGTSERDQGVVGNADLDQRKF